MKKNPIAIKRWNDESVIFQSTKTTMAEALQECITAKVLNLSSADLSSADLSSANLRSANLSSANLRSADLRSADLSSADLSYADLRSANLRSADLSSADLSSADLRSADLSSADLSYADLRSADLSYADLRSADFSYADLRYADFSSANLSYADLSSADLSSADLSSANLRSADLSYANLSSADLSSAKNIDKILNKNLIFAQTLIVPQDGDLIGWKKLKDGTICKLLIKDRVKRHNATGRKCRCERAVVLEGEGDSFFDKNIKYKKGLEVVATNYDPDRWNECSGGIHFFITKEEAEDYAI